LLTINIAFEGKGGQVLKQFTAEEHFLQEKVAIAQLSILKWQGISHEDIERHFSLRRALARHTPHPFLNNTFN
jgi:hypothetical protein